MPLGCTNSSAANYDPSATENDGSCVFLAKVGDNCYYFQEFNPAQIVDNSFTLSFTVEGNEWVFYHDYLPDFYIPTRDKLYTLKDKAIWKHNSGPMGKFYDTDPHPFFIDVVFNYEQEVLLDSVQWFTELLSNLGTVDEFTTFTHITVWNSHQCTGRLAITDYIPYDLGGIRKTVSEFSYNELRDIVKDRSGEFVSDIFSNFRPIDAALDMNMPWYDKRFLQSNYFIVRLEYDNAVSKALSLHNSGIIATPTVR